MSRRVKRIVLFGMTGMLLLCPVVGGYVHHFRPLLKSKTWSTEVSLNGEKTVLATTYQMMGRSKVLFIQLPASHQSGHKWFAIHLESKLVAEPSWPRQRPYLNFTHDMSLGVGLTDPKLGEDWKITWIDESPSFTNGTLELILKKKKTY